MKSSTSARATEISVNTLYETMAQLTNSARSRRSQARRATANWRAACCRTRKRGACSAGTPRVSHFARRVAAKPSAFFRTMIAIILIGGFGRACVLSRLNNRKR